MGATLLCLWGTRKTLEHLRKTPPHLDAPFGLIPVSILKPLKGIDEGLEENLESFFKIDYPEFEILFSVADAHDPAIAVVNSLKQRFPRVNCTLVIGAESVGPNPKVNNMIRAYHLAKNDWVLISDSNVSVESNYVRRLAAHVESDTGIVTSIVAGRNESELGGHLEAMFLNSFYARWMVLARAFGNNIVVGKSMLFKRSVANRFGGMKALACYLAEDYMAGKAMQHLGYKVVLAHDPIAQRIGDYSLSDFWRRHIRWGRIRKAQSPLAFYFEPLTTSFVASMIGAIGLNGLFAIPLFAGFLSILSLWLISDLALQQALSGRSFKWNDLLIWVLREAIHFPLWLQILSGRRVYWRGQYLKVRIGGIIDERQML